MNQEETAQSNTLDFKVYGTEEKLIDHLKLENAVQTSDGKYLYDMDPWAIPYFGGENETVTVPAEIKACMVLIQAVLMENWDMQFRIWFLYRH